MVQPAFEFCLLAQIRGDRGSKHCTRRGLPPRLRRSASESSGDLIQNSNNKMHQVLELVILTLCVQIVVKQADLTGDVNNGI